MMPTLADLSQLQACFQHFPLPIVHYWLFSMGKKRSEIRKANTFIILNPAKTPFPQKKKRE